MGVQYADDLGQSMPFDKFYDAMADGAEHQAPPRSTWTNSSPISPRFLEQGLDILHVTPVLGHLRGV